MVSRATAAPSAAENHGPHPFDAEYGVDTGGIIGGGDLTTGHAHDAFITAYAGIPPSRFQATIRRWAETIPAGSMASYAFVDLGCGKGRAVLLASELGFREVIGVELNPDLMRVAEANLAIWKEAGKGSGAARVVRGDATEFELPPGPCLVYLVNPFGAVVLRKLLQKLEARAAAGGGPLDVIYQNPEQAAVFTEFPGFKLLWSEAIAMSPEDAAVDPVYSGEDKCNGYRQ